MEPSDPFLFITSAAIVATLLAPLAARLIERAAADFLTSAGRAEPTDSDLSRIRRRR